MTLTPNSGSLQRQGWATDDRMKVQWGPLVKETAERISRTVGHRPQAARIGAH